MVWTSPYEPIDLDGPPLPQLVRHGVERAALIDATGGDGVSHSTLAERIDATSGDVVSYSTLAERIDAEGGQVMSYSTLAERIDAVAAGLAARGFRPGDVLAVWAPNLPAWAEVALGAMAAGGAVTGISPLATENDAASQLTQSRASVLVAAPQLAAPARTAAAAAGLEWVEVLGAAPDPRLERRLRQGEPDEVDGQATRVGGLDAGSLALLPCSSGTTGLPKLVMLTHRNLAAAIAQVRRGLDLGERDVVLGIAPVRARHGLRRGAGGAARRRGDRRRAPAIRPRRAARRDRAAPGRPC